MLPKSLTSALLFTLLAASMASATPVYYTFAGTINSINAPQGEYVVGAALNYTFRIDLDAAAYLNQYGTSSYYQDIADGNGTIDYFLVDYVGGNALATDYNPGSPIEFHRGWSQNYGNSVNANLTGSNFDPAGGDMISLGHDGTIDTWFVGQSGFTTTNFNRQTNLSGSMTLTAISDQNPYEAVPEPTSVAMVGFGLLGLGFAARKGRKD